MQQFERRSWKTKKVHADNDDDDNDDDGHRVIARVTLTRWVWLKTDLPFDFLSVCRIGAHGPIFQWSYFAVTMAGEVQLLAYVTPIFIGPKSAHTDWFFIIDKLLEGKVQLFSDQMSAHTLILSTIKNRSVFAGQYKSSVDLTVMKVCILMREFGRSQMTYLQDVTLSLTSIFSYTEHLFISN